MNIRFSYNAEVFFIRSATRSLSKRTLLYIVSYWSSELGVWISGVTSPRMKHLVKKKMLRAVVHCKAAKRKCPSRHDHIQTEQIIYFKNRNWDWLGSLVKQLLVQNKCMLVGSTEECDSPLAVGFLHRHWQLRPKNLCGLKLRHLLWRNSERFLLYYGDCHFEYLWRIIYRGCDHLQLSSVSSGNSHAKCRDSFIAWSCDRCTTSFKTSFPENAGECFLFAFQ